MSSAYALTLREVIDDALRYCNDFKAVGADGHFWTRAEVKTYANNALIDLVRRTGILKETRTIVLTKDIAVYTFPTNCTRPLRIVINGLDGTVLLPASMSDLDIIGYPTNVSGTPYRFIRDTLGPNQFAVFYAPNETGSQPTGTAAGAGLLRQVSDEDGNMLPYDATSALRWVRGVPFTRTGTAGVIRELVNTAGNLQVTYVRMPEEWDDFDQAPDSEIPDYIHARIKYGMAEIMIPPMLSRHPWLAKKLDRASRKWKKLLEDLQRNSEHLGPMSSFTPL